MENKLVFILVHIKQHLTQDGQGHLFVMVQSDIHNWLQGLRPVLLAAWETLDVVLAGFAASLDAGSAPPTGPFLP